MTSRSLGKIDSRQAIIYLTYAAVFLTPLDAFLLYVPLLAAAVLAVYRRLRFGRGEWRTGPFPLAAAGFFACSALSIIFSVDRAFSLFNWCFLPCMYAAMYLLIVSYIRTEKERRRMLAVIAAAAVCVIAYGLWQFADIGHMSAEIAAQDWVDPERFPLLYRRMYSTLENPNLLAGYLLMMIGLFTPFALLDTHKGQRGMILGFAAALVLCLLLTYSRGAWVSLAVMAAVLGFLYDRRIWLIFLAVPAVLLLYHGQITERFLSLFSGEDTSILLRVALWDSTEMMIEEHPLTGVGWGAYFEAYPAYNYFIADPNVIIYHAHNMYLSIPAEVGLPGGIFYFILFFGHGFAAARLWRRGTSAFGRAAGLGGALAASGMAVYGLGDYVLFSRAVSFCFWALCAFCVSEEEDEEDRKI